MNEGMAGERVTRIAKFIVDVVWWFTLIGVVALAAWLLLSPVVIPGFSMEPIIADVHVSIGNTTAQHLLPLTTQDTLVASHPVLTDVDARLQLHTGQWWFQLLAGLVQLAGLVVVLAGAHLVRSFLRDVRSENVFTVANARRLTWLGWLLVGAGVVLPFLDGLRSTFVVHHAGVGGVPLVTGMGVSRTVLWGLLVLVLAAAWRYGAELQQDRDLTV